MQYSLQYSFFFFFQFHLNSHATRNTELYHDIFRFSSRFFSTSSSPFLFLQCKNAFVRELWYNFTPFQKHQSWAMIRQLSFFVLLFSRSCSGYHVTEHCKETLKNAVNEYLYHYRDSRTKKDLQLYFRYQPFFFIVEILEKYLRVLQRIPKTL